MIEPYAQPPGSGGRRSFHGRARSSCAASLNSVASSPKRATNCTPVGKPAALCCNGRFIAGWPLMLNSMVFIPGILSLRCLWLSLSDACANQIRFMDTVYGRPYTFYNNEYKHSLTRMSQPRCRTNSLQI